MAHIPQGKLASTLNKVEKIVHVGDKYYHYKNPSRFYRIIVIGLIEETQRTCVVYKSLYGEKIVWVRKASDFLAKVNLPDGSKVDRFTKVE